MGQISENLRFVCATRLAKLAFERESVLAQSLKCFSGITPVQIRVFYNNTKSLGEIYNCVIDESEADPAILVFVHDDLLIADFFWAERVLEGLDDFDLVGLAGNRERHSKQPSWFFKEVNPYGMLIKDSAKNLSGCVAHGKKTFPVPVRRYGPVAECRLLDGVFLAVRSRTLINHQIRFDPQFRFHFYDLDFCRQFEAKGLRMGTIELSSVHESGGNFKSPEWERSYQLYLKKWRE